MMVLLSNLFTMLTINNFLKVRGNLITTVEVSSSLSNSADSKYSDLKKSADSFLEDFLLVVVVVEDSAYYD